MTRTVPDPLVATVHVIRRAARGPRRYRTRKSYLQAVRPADRLFFDRAWEILRRRGELVIDPAGQTHRPARYLAADPR
jgi:hypothetical protein